MAIPGRFSREISAALEKGLGMQAIQLPDQDTPNYHFRVDGQDWFVEVVRGNYFPDESARDLQRRARAFTRESRAAIFIPEGEEIDDVMPVAVARDLAVILKRGSEYALAMPRGRPGTIAPALLRNTRIPPGLADRVAGLTKLPAEFREALTRFSSQHAELRDAVSGADEGTAEREVSLLKETFQDLVRSDSRFIGTHDPLDVLRELESRWQQTDRAKRDHYFHSFQNFLLGCVAINGLHQEFEEWFQAAFPPSGIPVEYVWLLTALFHDVGYAIQKGPDVDAVLFGMDRRVDLGTGKSSDVIPEYEMSKRMEFWNSIDYRWHRRQLVSMVEHLTTPAITSDWAPNVFLGQDVPESAFDSAMEDSFMSPESHGAASALLLLRAINKQYRGDLPAPTKALVQKSMYVAAVSIPVHDWQFRNFLSSRGVGSIRSRRFPLAVLLTYIDSIQDDRREFGNVFAPDVLEDLNVEEDGTVVARIAVDRIPRDKLAGKQTEARGVVGYIVQDGLKFRYPPEFH